MESAVSNSGPSTRPVAPSDLRVVERLGSAGLQHVLSDLLDPSRLVKLANACKLSYPGMRMQSQKRDKILRDLAAKALVEEAAASKVLRAVRKEAAAAAKAWGALDPDRRLERLREAEGEIPGDVLLAAADQPLEPELERALSEVVQGLSGRPPAAAVRAGTGTPDDRRELARLRKRTTELQKKARHLEAQLAKYRDSEKALKRDLMQRKGELAESRMLAERLRRELHEAKGARGTAPAKAEGADALVAGLERDLKKLAAEQKRLVHRLDKIGDSPAPVAVLPDAALAPLAETLGGLEKEIGALRRERKRDVADSGRRLDEIHSAAAAARAAAETAASPSRIPARRRGEAERVAVFIDVQNVWYGARQLKGKLDFDALLQAAVRDRRLIQATAYVVESKEIDQSGFIARLDQRGIDVKRKTLKVRADGSTKGDWDMEMALDMLDAAPRLHVVVLVSGDGDFTSLVRRIKTIGPKVEVLSFPRNTAKSLIEASDKFHPLDRKYMIRDPAPQSPAPPARAKTETKEEAPT